jgi:hypothetical protein
MKKVLIGLSGMVILALVVILFVNAQSSGSDSKKPSSEVSAKCAGCKDAATCTEIKETTAVTAAPCTDAAKTEGSKSEVTASANSNCEANCPMKKALPVN